MNAENANIQTLDEAKKLAAQGEINETIRQMTGWFKGMDGKWRFEIDDSEITIKNKYNAERAEYKKLSEDYAALTGKIFNASKDNNQLRDDFLDFDANRNKRTYDYEGQFEKLFEAFGDDIIKWENLANDLEYERNELTEPRQLKDFIDAPELFTAYPQLENVWVKFEELDIGNNGYWDAENNEIILDNIMEVSNPLNTLVHEIQHAVQYIEGFTNGASSEYWEEKKENGYSYRENDGYIKRVEEEYRRIFEGAPQEFKEKIREINRARLNGDENKVITLIDVMQNSEYADLWDQLDMADFKRRSDRGKERTAYDLYHNTAGEIEARDVSARRNLTVEQRKGKAPDLGNENTVFMEDSDIGYAMSASEATSIKDQIVNYQDELNDMKIVAAINDNGWRRMNIEAFRRKIVTNFKSINFEVDRQNFGKIEFTEKELNKSFGYITTDAEAAAYLAIPHVLKRGIIISGHDNHKGRGYSTITIAAPVKINGGRGNMAIVIKQTKGNRYKVHRILTPEGGAFVLPEMAIPPLGASLK